MTIRAPGEDPYTQIGLARFVTFTKPIRCEGSSSWKSVASSQCRFDIARSISSIRRPSSISA